MTTKLSIGDFSRMTYLSVKALRHYHDVGRARAGRDRPRNRLPVLPAEPGRARADDPPAARPRHAARRGAPHHGGAGRDHPRCDSRCASAADGSAARADPADRRVTAHVAPAATGVTAGRAARRSRRRTRSRSRRSSMRPRRSPGGWTRSRCCTRPWRARVQRSGPDGALFPAEFFEEEKGEVTAFVPVDGDADGGSLPARVQPIVVPAITAAVTVHDGPFGDLDRTYGALGTWVLERAAGRGRPDPRVLPPDRRPRRLARTHHRGLLARPALEPTASCQTLWRL